MIWSSNKENSFLLVWNWMVRAFTYSRSIHHILSITAQVPVFTQTGWQPLGELDIPYIPKTTTQVPISKRWGHQWSWGFPKYQLFFYLKRKYLLIKLGIVTKIIPISINLSWYHHEIQDVALSFLPYWSLVVLIIIDHCITWITQLLSLFI